nr:1-phosphatidylinositol phosphodiesterase [Quercus suber]
MSGPITVRNLTPQPLTIKLIERYEAPSSGPTPTPSAGFSSFAANFTTFLSGGGGAATANPAPTSAQLGEKAQSFAKQAVDLRLQPFTTHLTDIHLTERAPHETLRLTFQSDEGGRWRVDVPTTTAASQTLTPLTPDPRHAFTAIYLADSAFLAVYESTALGSWMRAFRDATPLSALSIPGTHNSATCYVALPSVRCQAVSLREQLENGVRFLDVRVQPGRAAADDNDNEAPDAALTLVHGVFPISLTGPKNFRALLDVVHDFLRDHPSETVILSLKREGLGATTDQQLSRILHAHYATDAREWYTEPRVPTLGEVRGKIVLLRRFALAASLRSAHAGRGWALDAERWAFNTPDCACGDVRVQDFCEVLEPQSIARKVELCCAHFERAAAVVCAPSPPRPSGRETDDAVPPGPLYLNFLSASNFWQVACWPEKIAARLNPAVTAFLCMRHGVGDKGVKGPGERFTGDGGVGVVVCDWVGKDGDWDLVRCIVGMNGRLLLKQKEDGVVTIYWAPSLTAVASSDLLALAELAQKHRVIFERRRGISASSTLPPIMVLIDISSDSIDPLLTGSMVCSCFEPGYYRFATGVWLYQRQRVWRLEGECSSKPFPELLRITLSTECDSTKRYFQNDCSNISQA